MKSRPEQLRLLVRDVFRRYVDPQLHFLLEKPAGELRLGEDLGLDSLTLMEIVQRLEEVLPIVISDDELRHFRTLGEVDDAIEHAVNGVGEAVLGDADFPRDPASAA